MNIPTEQSDKLSLEPDFSFRKRPSTGTGFEFPTPGPATPSPRIDTSPNEPAVQPTSNHVVAPIPVTVQPQPITLHLVQTIRRPLSGLALSGFIIALASIPLAFFLPLIFSVTAIIIGHVSAYRTRHYDLTGHGFAIAALTIGYITFGLTLMVLAILAVAALVTGGIMHFFSQMSG